MEETTIGVSFKVIGGKEYCFEYIEPNLTSKQWNNITETEHEILVFKIGIQIKEFKNNQMINEDTVPLSLTFAPHFRSI